MIGHLPSHLLRAIATFGDPYAPSPTAVAREWRHEYEVAFWAALTAAASRVSNRVLPAAKQLCSELELGRAELIRFEYHLLARGTANELLLARGTANDDLINHNGEWNFLNFTREPLEVIDAAHAHILIRVRRGASIVFSSYGLWRGHVREFESFIGGRTELNTTPTQTFPESPTLTTATAFHLTDDDNEWLKNAAEVIDTAWGTTGCHDGDSRATLPDDALRVDAFVMLIEQDPSGRYQFRSSTLAAGAGFHHELDNDDFYPGGCFESPRVTLQAGFPVGPGRAGSFLWDIEAHIKLIPYGDGFGGQGRHRWLDDALCGSSSGGLEFGGVDGEIGGCLGDTWLPIRVQLKTEVSDQKETQHHSVESVSLGMVWQFEGRSQHNTMDLLLNRLVWDCQGRHRHRHNDDDYFVDDDDDDDRPRYAGPKGEWGDAA